MARTVKLTFMFLFGIAAACSFFRDHRKETKIDSTLPDAFRPLLPPWLYLMYFGILLLSEIFRKGFLAGATAIWNGIIPVVLHICLYYCLLILLLPVLRKYIRPKACAALWLIPNILYIMGSFPQAGAPLIAISIPGALFSQLPAIWLAGFGLSFGWQLFSHFRMRKALLDQSRQLFDRDILSVWENTETTLSIRFPNPALYRCSGIQTPITVGLRKKTMRVLLPCREYTQEELSLIFRHELIHIKRRDNLTKLTLAFFTSLFWFNPLGILAKRRCSEDLELACDEAVLRNEPDSLRKRYANLLLSTAGNDKGFSTCLSASAKSLLYRIQNTLKPQKRLSGAIAVGLVCAVLFVTCGALTVSYPCGTASEAIFSDALPEEYRFDVIKLSGDETRYRCSDPDALMRYLETVPLHTMAGAYYADEADWFHLSYKFPGGHVQISFSDHKVTVLGHHSGEMIFRQYYHEEPFLQNRLMAYVQ